MKLSVLSALNRARAGRRAAILVTPVDGGEARLVLEEGVDGDPLAGELAARFRSGRSGTVETEAGSFMLSVSLPPPRLVVIGAVHISQALAPMARIAGFDMTVIDPRTAFATAARFGEVELVAEWPEEALKRAPLDAFTALAAMTHDPKIDDYPIKAALEAGCFYVGALGSRKTHQRRLERLRAEGVGEALLGRIHAPIGLAIGAVSPAEIAVSVLAEIIQSLRQRGAEAAEKAA